MDSEESRPGSSASNSSSNSSDNSRPSSPSAVNEDGELAASKSPRPRSIASPQSSGGRRSRPRSRSSNEDEEAVQSPPQSPPLSLHSPRSQSKSDSESGGSSSSSSSDENEPEDAKSAGSGALVKSKTSSDRSSSEGSMGIVNTRQSADSRQQSVSPANSHPSSRNSRISRNSGNSRISRNSSASSLRSGSITPARNLIEETGINISHEDLSDVSEMESEKRVASPANSKQSLAADDDGTNSPAVVPAALEREEHIAGPEKESQRRYSTNCDDDNSETAEITDLRQKLDQKKNQYKNMERDTSPTTVAMPSFSNGKVLAAGQSLDDFAKTQDEDALDFEAEEGECQDISKDEEDEEQQKRLAAGNEKGDADAPKKMADNKSDGEAEEGEELEEGEVSDEDEKRPEETEPKPVCRFYTRGQCTWGMSCRFLHPGVTDKGNYTMFDLVRPVPVTSTNPAGARSSSYAPHATDYHDYRTDRPPLHHRAPLHHPTTGAYAAHHEPRAALPDGPVVVESAWERGLRTAKEMMRKANKRKEQDMDFEDKKMNLTLSPDELEKDPYYLKERVSPPEVVPPPSYGRHAAPYTDVPPAMYSQPERFGRGPPLPLPPYDEVDPYGRNMRYRELPPHRMPQYEDERRVRPTREVIVQRVPEPVGRGDEWNDPWMRSKSPGGRGGSRERGPGDKRRRDRRSYSSNSSYSSSSSSQSDSSSESSRSPTPTDHRRRYNSGPHKSPPPPPPGRRHAAMRAARSPSPTGRRARLSPTAFLDPKIDHREPKAKMFGEQHELLVAGGLHLTPPAKRGRAHISPPPAMAKRSGYSPATPHKRKRTPPSIKKIGEKIKTKRHHSSSSSGSSDSSASDSESDSGSSSSESSSRSKERTPPKRNRLAEKAAHVDRKLIKKVVEPPKKRSPISIEIKKQATVGTSALAVSPTHSVSSEKDTKKSRREELLKQLRAVEDAIAKKRSKLA